MKEVRKTLVEASRLTNLQPTKDIINNANIVKTAFNNHWKKDLEIINNEEPLIEVESDYYNNSLIISYKKSNIKFVCSF
jgi:hypothetical protein